MLDRLMHGVGRVLLSPVRLAVLPFTFAANMLSTGVDSLKALAKGDIGGAFGTLLGGTVNSAGKAGFTLFGGGNPIMAFMSGAIMKTGNRLD